ncbi:MAG: hypothetical protein L0H53_09700 [Candidatus Nitrosocosmicus sp.]|nr:hypothetical protein [Candidatus Nitrosocosmicus sp.]MDN5868245.1 hypothetical protein [Candidatus Nitrosocosmicus sp.]
MAEDHSNISESRMIVKQTIDQDRVLVDKMTGKGLLTDEIYKIYQERVKLYDDALNNQSLNDNTDRIFLDYRRSDLFVDLKVFKFKIAFEEQIGQIMSRLDEQEDQIKILKKRLVEKVEEEK